MTSAWRVGIDIGGTFTDVVAVNTAGGAVRMGKVLSQADPVSGIINACSSLGLQLSDVSDIMHGTTMATNAIVEGRLAPIALIATEGFAEVLDIGRQNRRELYKMAVTPRPDPLVPGDRRLEARQRMDAQGAVITPLGSDEIERLAKAVKALGVESVAVSLIHSYLNGDHETRIGEGLRSIVPFVALSHQLNPEPREYERTNSTAMNAALMPLVARYLERLIERIGSQTGLHMFHSAGGMASAASIASRPLALALSGPAAGVAAASAVAQQLGLGRVISFDMGGTTTDVSIIVDGKMHIDSNQRMAGYPIRQMMVAVETIGAGGGSIARRDGQAVRVGPDSAGADPGPACYGLGGTQPTVADANIILGYIESGRELGGTVRLDVKKAEAAFTPLAEAFGTTVHEAALGVRRVANSNMARALRRVTVEHGVDARTCALLAFGGAGPMHAVSLAREFGIGKVLVPRFSSGFSAFGCMTARMSYAEQRPLHMRSDRWNAKDLEAAAGRIADRLVEPLVKAGCAVDTLRVSVAGLLRYTGQSDAVEVPLVAPYDLAQVDASFKAIHERLYGFATDEVWEVDTLRVSVSAPPKQEVSALPAEGDAKGTDPVAVRRCWFDGGVAFDTPHFDRDRLPVGAKIKGPAIIEDAWSTIVVDPGATAWADEHAHLHIDVEGGLK
ncbi:hydantoinase/oxoprolinase family protein [Albidovulum sp.]|uniref:hydantoinase/oxoprolinase family protein n=1 Tax=Albidovulum sp. TaxID=1872424 RepID=UPI0039B832EE